MVIGDDIALLCFQGCVPGNASYVAVTVPVKTIDTNYKNNYVVNVISSMSILQNTLAFLYSDETLRSTDGWQNKVTYCKVKKDATTGTRYFYFRFRRYIYDETFQKFIPGFMDVTQDKSISSWLDKSYLHQGLSHEEATRRLGVVGPNVLDLKKPTILLSILTEFSKLFYLYQTFMVWTWGKNRILSLFFLPLFCDCLGRDTYNSLSTNIQHPIGIITWHSSIRLFELLVVSSCLSSST